MLIIYLNTQYIIEYAFILYPLKCMSLVIATHPIHLPTSLLPEVYKEDCQR